MRVHSTQLTSIQFAGGNQPKHWMLALLCTLSLPSLDTLHFKCSSHQLTDEQWRDLIAHAPRITSLSSVSLNLPPSAAAIVTHLAPPLLPAEGPSAFLAYPRLKSIAMPIINDDSLAKYLAAGIAHLATEAKISTSRPDLARAFIASASQLQHLSLFGSGLPAADLPSAPMPALRLLALSPRAQSDVVDQALRAYRAAELVQVILHFLSVAPRLVTVWVALSVGFLAPDELPLLLALIPALKVKCITLKILAPRAVRGTVNGLLSALKETPCWSSVKVVGLDVETAGADDSINIASLWE